MQLLEKGRYFTYTYNCKEEDKGTILTNNELEAFARDCLLLSFEITGKKYIRHDAGFESGADFSFKKYNRTILGVVKYFSTEEERKQFRSELRSKFDLLFPKLEEAYIKYGSLPVFYIAKIDNTDKENPVAKAGDKFHITYTVVVPRFLNIPAKGRRTSELTLLKGFAKCWETGDTSFIENYVDSHFQGSSDFSFDEIYTKEELIQFLKLKHDNWKRNGINVTCHVIISAISNTTGLKSILCRINGFDAFCISINILLNKIFGLRIKAVPSKYEEYQKKYPLYQTHGDHHYPFVDDTEFSYFLNATIHVSTLIYQRKELTLLSEEREQETTVTQLIYGNRQEIQYAYIGAFDPEEGKNILVSAYPYLLGKSIPVTILEIMEWDNHVEANIKCVYKANDEEFIFCFFATDYFINKELYRKGEMIEIGLAASGGNISFASRGFSFEGKKAEDFLAKIGQPPTYDKEGNIEPVNFSTEKLIAFLPHDYKCPDIAEFQSPAYSSHSDTLTFDNKKINVRNIKINERTGLEIPLYFNSNLIPKNEDPITGLIWLSGRMSNFFALPPHGRKILFNEEPYVGSAIIFRKFAEITHNPFDETFQFNELISKFIYIKLTGYDLRIIKVQDQYQFYHKFYPEKSGREVLDSINIKDLNLLPDLMDCIQVSPQKEGIWQAFLLNISSRFLPCFGEYYKIRKYINLMSIPIPRYAEKVVYDRNFEPTITFDKETGFGYVVIYYYEINEIFTSESKYLQYLQILYREIHSFRLKEGKIKFHLDGRYEISRSFIKPQDYV